MPGRRVAAHPEGHGSRRGGASMGRACPAPTLPWRTRSSSTQPRAAMPA